MAIQSDYGRGSTDSYIDYRGSVGTSGYTTDGGSSSMSAFGLIAPIIQAVTGRRDNMWRTQEARHAERFSERMSNTAFQRQFADMRAAGLNPLVAFQSGGASAPTGVAANIDSGDIGGSVASAIALRRQEVELDLMKEQANRESTQAEANKTASAVNVKMLEKLNAEIKNIGVNTARGAAELPKAELGSDFWTEFGKVARDLGGKAKKNFEHADGVFKKMINDLNEKLSNSSKKVGSGASGEW